MQSAWIQVGGAPAEVTLWTEAGLGPLYQSVEGCGSLRFQRLGIEVNRCLGKPSPPCSGPGPGGAFQFHEEPAEPGRAQAQPRLSQPQGWIRVRARVPRLFIQRFAEKQGSFCPVNYRGFHLMPEKPGNSGPWEAQAEGSLVKGDTG